jgi:hypothetical protein
MSHVFHRANLVGTLGLMRLKPAILRLVSLPVLMVLIGSTSCSVGGNQSHPGAIAIRITVANGLGVEHCRRSPDPDEVLKDITIRDSDGNAVAHTTVYGRDASKENYSGPDHPCTFIAEKEVEVPMRGEYEISADDETVILHRWPYESIDDCYFRDCKDYFDSALVRFFARGGPGIAETLAELGLNGTSPEAGVTCVELVERSARLSRLMDPPQFFCEVLMRFWLERPGDPKSTLRLSYPHM